MQPPAKQNPSPNGSRRSFLKAGAAGATAAAVAMPQRVQAAPKANERMRIGFIGPGGRGFGAHVKTLCNLHAEGRNIDLVGVAEVYETQRDKVADFIKEKTGTDPARYVDYRDMIAKENLDAVCIGTPDHWHHKQTVDALAAGLNVYCEKPMTKTVEEAFDVESKWRESGKVMQVGVQSTSLPVWNEIRALLQDGVLGKVLGFQTEYFRNSNVGQWRYYKLVPDMSPKKIDWDRWLGKGEGLAPEMPFDRAVYKQWRRFWPFGSGMFTDLFVHRTTSMLKATGLRIPGRVVGAGGIYLEYDGRDVPDVATVVADFNEGVQGLVTATMCNQESRVNQLIRGHYGTFALGNGEGFDGFEFIPERRQVTTQGDSGRRRFEAETIATEPVKNTTHAHFANFLDACEAGDPSMCNNPPDLGAAAMAVVNLGAQSYRKGHVYFVDSDSREISTTDPGWAKKWEAKSAARQSPNHIPGWNAGEFGSRLDEPTYMDQAGPWIDGQDPAGA
ncbi:Gfo/Idh/MocA family oxidoreductase [Roseiconus nitratireducens]|uniref:Gfo/Idh/MocA family oxidoreductase n=1 Tax=Roseiconus nitratireducens TaxID=2605748 RepID=A0A5M6D1T9_9BACT|nr:Gfo/Idh/MocA family oxidoreductase [Roseiconus nitratireducens]KAA5541471.1 Gfo/Idh/MocA family oxidoreductase [Roseiconus nitratireducens]